MECIFCRKPSDNSKSIEHIIPESLGNKEHILEKGLVCDACNNYFASKIEKILLEQPYFINLRHRNIIRSKKNHLIPETCFSPKFGPARIWFDLSKNGYSLCFESDNKTAFGLKTGEEDRLIIPMIQEPESNNYMMSRFLAKCALESMILRIGKKNVFEFLKDANYSHYDHIRKYARFGEGCNFWPYSQRRIYSEDTRFIDKNENDGLPYEVLHELDFLMIDHTAEYSSPEGLFYFDIYFVLAIMGIEYVISLAEPTIDGYNEWLHDNNNISPIERSYEKKLIDNHPLLFQYSNDFLEKAKRK
jgi:hypothetical protein